MAIPKHQPNEECDCRVPGAMQGKPYHCAARQGDLVLAGGNGWRIELRLVCLTCTAVLDNEVPIVNEHPGHLIIATQTLVWELA